MYAVIATGGKQYRVTPGARIKVEILDGEPGQQIEFSDVLFVGGEEGGDSALPALEEVKVLGTIEQQERGDKITIFRYKKRKMYRRKQGHRQYLTSVRIDQVGAVAKAPVKSAETSQPDLPEAPADEIIETANIEAGQE